MRNPFKKTPPAPEFLKARDMNTFAIHIQDPEGFTLCGTKNALKGQYEVTAQNLVDSAHLQHDGWYWCPRCASVLTGETPEFFREARFNSGK